MDTESDLEESDSSSSLHDSVVVGDTYHGTVIREQIIHQNTAENVTNHVVHHLISQPPSIGPDPVPPSSQVWFMGKRIWHPQMGMMILSVIFSLLVFVLPVVPALIGIGIAVTALRAGELRALIPLAIGTLFLFVSFAFV